MKTIAERVSEGREKGRREREKEQAEVRKVVLEVHEETDQNITTKNKTRKGQTPTNERKHRSFEDNKRKLQPRKRKCQGVEK